MYCSENVFAASMPKIFEDFECANNFNSPDRIISKTGRRRIYSAGKNQLTKLRWHRVEIYEALFFKSNETHCDFSFQIDENDMIRLEWITKENHFSNLDSESGQILRNKIKIIEFESCLTYFMVLFPVRYRKTNILNNATFPNKMNRITHEFHVKKRIVKFRGSESPLGFDQDGL